MTNRTEISQMNHHRAVRFFWSFLVAATAVSLIGNVAHAVLLSIAESLLTQHQPRRPGPDPAGPVGQKHGELVTVAEVAEMTRLSVGTLRWWRAVGEGGPESFKLGRRVMYRRADIEKWLDEAQ
jgi:predicted DNA-binding transcriptional regulator AlpA